jgi:hypothetical protein
MRDRDLFGAAPSEAANKGGYESRHGFPIHHFSFLTRRSESSVWRRAARHHPAKAWEAGKKGMGASSLETASSKL